MNTFGRGSSGEFAYHHETHEDLLQAAIDNWLDGIYNFEYGFDPATMQRIAGVRPMHRQIDHYFWTPLTHSGSDARAAIVQAYQSQQLALGTEGADFVRRRWSRELNIMFAPQIDFIKSDWEAGRMVRYGSVLYNNSPGIMYNHMPSFTFTGEIAVLPRINEKTGERTQGFMPVVDLSPLLDEGGRYVPYRQDAQVIVLPDPLQTSVHIDTMRDHILALRQAVHPSYVRFMPDWHDVTPVARAA